MIGFWQNTMLVLAQTTFLLVVVFWHVVPHPIVRWIMMVANLIFTLVFIMYAFSLSKKK